MLTKLTKIFIIYRCKLCKNLIFSKQKQVQPSKSASSNASAADGTASLQSPPKMQEGAFQLGLLKFCHSSAKKCYGCGHLLKMKGGDGQWHIPLAPNDLVIVTAMRRSYWQNGEQKRGHLGNVYFHCRVECVQAMQAAFLPFLVVIPSGLRPHLSLTHRQHLKQELQMLV